MSQLGPLGPAPTDWAAYARFLEEQEERLLADSLWPPSRPSGPVITLHALTLGFILGWVVALASWFMASRWLQ